VGEAQGTRHEAQLQFEDSEKTQNIQFFTQLITGHLPSAGLPTFGWQARASCLIPCASCLMPFPLITSPSLLEFPFAGGVYK
jgi:hypothetical protein